MANLLSQGWGWNSVGVVTEQGDGEHARNGWEEGMLRNPDPLQKPQRMATLFSPQAWFGMSRPGNSRSFIVLKYSCSASVRTSQSRLPNVSSRGLSTNQKLERRAGSARYRSSNRSARLVLRR